MMMKLTVTFLATLAAAEAAHGRRHVRRDDYGYQPYPVPHKSSSSSTAPFPLSTGVPSFSLDLTSTASSTSPEGITFTGTAPTGTGSIVSSETSVIKDASSDIVPSSSTGVKDATTDLIPSSSIIPYPTGTGVRPPPVGTGGVPPPPVGTGVSSLPYGEYITTTTIYSTQIHTITLTKENGEVSTSLSTTVEAIPSKCTKTSGVPTAPADLTSVSKVVHVSTETLTYTVGVGSTAHAVTTEIVQTSTETIYKTVVITLPYTKGGASTTGAAEGPEGTTVISQTSTTTKFITVYPTPSAGAEGSVSPPLPTGDAPICAPPQTVTVTEKETVTVTASKEEVPVTTQAPAASTSAVVTEIISSSKLLPSSAPYPFDNSTALPTIGSTGFVTYTKPTGTGAVGTSSTILIKPTGDVGTTSTIISTKGTEPTELPSFVFPTKGSVSSTGKPAEGPSSTSAAPIGYPQPSKKAEPSKGGHNYGYRRRA